MNLVWDYNVLLIWLGIGRLTVHYLKPRTVAGELAVLIAWPFVMVAAGILGIVREWRRARDFPRPTIVRYRAARHAHLYGREHERSASCISSTPTTTEHR